MTRVDLLLIYDVIISCHCNKKIFSEFELKEIYSSESLILLRKTNSSLDIERNEWCTTFVFFKTQDSTEREPQRNEQMNEQMNKHVKQ